MIKKNKKQILSEDYKYGIRKKSNSIESSTAGRSYRHSKWDFEQSTTFDSIRYYKWKII